MKNLTKFATITIALSTTLTACKTLDNRISTVRIDTFETQTLWVAPKREICFGVVAMECLRVQLTTANSSQPNEEKWENLYQEIEGFQWQQGKLSKVRVKVIPVKSKNLSADSSNVRYKLIQVLQ